MHENAMDLCYHILDVQDWTTPKTYRYQILNLGYMGSPFPVCVAETALPEDKLIDITSKINNKRQMPGVPQ